MTHKLCEFLLFVNFFFFSEFLFLFYKSFFLINFPVIIHPFLSFFCGWYFHLWRWMNCFSPITTFLNRLYLRTQEVTMSFSYRMMWSKFEFLHLSWPKSLFLTFQLMLKLFLQRLEIRHRVRLDENPRSCLIFFLQLPHQRLLSSWLLIFSFFQEEIRQLIPTASIPHSRLFLKFLSSLLLLIHNLG